MFEEESMLRVYQRRFPRSEAEERSVEHFDVVENRFGLHVVWVLEDLRTHAFC